jgi:hypothetical protein
MGVHDHAVAEVVVTPGIRSDPVATQEVHMVVIGPDPISHLPDLEGAQERAGPLDYLGAQNGLRAIELRDVAVVANRESDCRQRVCTTTGSVPGVDQPVTSSP